jgi:hypothetical protein
MITSQQLQSLSVEEFASLYRESIIQQYTELITGKVLCEQMFNKKPLLVYEMSNVPYSFHVPILESLKTRLAVASIYMIKTFLYVDWSVENLVQGK